MIDRRSLLAAAGILAGGGTAGRAAPALAPDMFARSEVALGDPARLHRVFAKARRGEPVTLGVIGGSITAGALASRPDLSYAGRVETWWRRRFPATPIRLVNAGVGGTGSAYGALRAGEDLLASRPDLVIVEFAVNDGWNEGASYEGLLRQILALPGTPAVVCLFMMWQGGGNSQESQARIGAHYRLPMVSFRDAVWPAMAGGRLAETELLVDGVHPNDAGHEAAALFLARLFERIDQMPARSVVPAGVLPSPLISDAFQFVEWRRAAVVTPDSAGGWARRAGEGGRPAWFGSAASGPLVLSGAGTGLVVVLQREPGDPGRLRLRLDGADLPDPDREGGAARRVIVVAEGLERRRHSLEITRVDGPGGSGGSTEIGLIGLGGIGLR